MNEQHPSAQSSQEPAGSKGPAPALLVLAAGMGSRYGGLKQMDPMGPSGEWLLEYSVHDAWRAGFGNIVFVIRRDFAEAFCDALRQRLPGEIRWRVFSKTWRAYRQGRGLRNAARSRWAPGTRSGARRRRSTAPSR